ncbi:MAG: DUF6383 domain-containing protein [Dysgonamonadaceae bacterium]|jgi:hypothetical protein|nr:DUF6383 domain-containing protein [Dysgonamonadaceae bacterium]
MKKKLFTLLLAAAGLSIFQANADEEKGSWIRVDKSGLAKHVSQPNPFPKNKSGFDSWLSVKEDTVYVRSQKFSNANSSEIVTDEHSKFNVESAGSTRFKISSKSKSGVSLKAKWDDIEVSSFEIVQFDDAGKKVDRSISDSIKGYPVFLFTGSEKTADNAVLAGADKAGNISFKAFSEFAVHADSLPASPCLSYQFEEEKKNGRLYQSDSYPFFQIYHERDEQDSALVATGGERINWSERRKPETPKSQNPIYSYYEFKYVNDSISINDSTVHLETIVNYVKSHTYEYQTDHRYGISKGDSLSGIDTATVGNKNDSLLYFKVQDGLITFTALAADGSWTNEKPTELKYEGQDVWYYIDATDTTKAFFAMKLVLIDLFGFEYNYFVPDSNQVERYIYKNVDDWQPLYIKAVSVKQPQPYEYVTKKWLNDHEFNFTSAKQYISGGDGKAISTSATVSTTENAARLKFEPAARIDTAGTISGLTGTTFAGGDIELFYIKNDNQYLTVDTNAVPNNSKDATVTNTKLIWENKIASSEGADTLRQAFAIVRNTDDSVFTFLPVASYKHQGTTYGNILHYNQHIGEMLKDDMDKDLSVDISGAWYITSQTNSDSERVLVITSNTDVGVLIWLKLDVTLNEWKGHNYGDYFVVIYKNDSTHYSASGIFANEKDASLADSIRSHWIITSEKQYEGKYAKYSRWVFTPRIDTIYGVAQNTTLTDTVIANQLSDKDIELIRTNNSRRDTVQVERIEDPYTLPFKKFESDSVNVAILASGTEYNLSKDNDENAFLKPITESDTFRVVLHRSNVQTLAAGLEVPYYIFSTADSLFLKANTVTESVQWVKPESDEITLSKLLDDTDWSADCAQYKFCLPYKGGVENEDVYLQTLDSTQKENYGLVVNGSVLFGLNASKFESVLNQTNNYVAGEGIYSAIDQYNSHIKPIASWKIVPAGEDPGQGTGLRKVGSPAKIYGAAGEVRVVGASGAVSVYSIDGRPVWAGAVVSPNQTIAVSAGIYIVKNGVHVVKVVVK